MAGQGTKIVATDYNAIQSQINTVMGTGSGTSGYGQTVLSSQVAVNSKISATQWNNLQTDLQNAYAHIFNTIGSLTTATTSTSIKESDRAAYAAMSGTVAANQLAVPPSGQATLTNLTTGTKTSAWNGTITHTATLTFPSANAARYFFNTGSQIQISGSIAGSTNQSTPTSKGYAWNAIFTGMGVISLGYGSTTATGTGNSIASSTGYYQLAATPGVNTLLFQKVTSSSTYTPNQYDLYAQVDGSGTIITLSIMFEDLATFTNTTTYGPYGPFGVDENVDGTLTSSIQAYYASGSNVSVAAYIPAAYSSGP